MIYTAGGSMESGHWLTDVFAYTKPTEKQFCKSLFDIDIRSIIVKQTISHQHANFWNWWFGIIWTSNVNDNQQTILQKYKNQQRIFNVFPK